MERKFVQATMNVVTGTSHADEMLGNAGRILESVRQVEASFRPVVDGGGAQ